MKKFMLILTLSTVFSSIAYIAHDVSTKPNLTAYDDIMMTSSNRILPGG